jgi:deoxyribonuclease V
VTAEELVREQEKLAAAEPPPWTPAGVVAVGACFVCFDRDRGWAAAAATSVAVVEGKAGAPYQPGLLALREGALLEAAVQELGEQPDVLLVNATGRDHPRRAGLALHLGAVLDLPTVGITHRLLLAEGDWPPDERGAKGPFHLGGELVGYWLRTRRGTRPLGVHAAWRTDADTAANLVAAGIGSTRTPEPLRRARQLARTARASARL